MKKLTGFLTLIALAAILSGCCCPCCKKAPEQKPQESQTMPQEQPSK